MPGLGLGGYSFQLAVALKPPVDARGCVLAMFLHIKAGSYDALLKWPFPIPFTLTVLDQRDPDAQGDGTLPSWSFSHISRRTPVALALVRDGHPRATRCAPRNARALGVLIGARNPMVVPYSPSVAVL